jgi:hypothetical protein
MRQAWLAKSDGVYWSGQVFGEDFKQITGTLFLFVNDIVPWTEDASPFEVTKNDGDPNKCSSLDIITQALLLCINFKVQPYASQYKRPGVQSKSHIPANCCRQSGELHSNVANISTDHRRPNKSNPRIPSRQELHRYRHPSLYRDDHDASSSPFPLTKP